MTSRLKVFVPVLVGLAIVEYLIYFHNASHFFQGDTIYWFYHRLTSFGQFAQSFVTTDPGGWYRPLTNRTVQWLLYPIFGFEPAPYRYVLFFLFLADIGAVMALSLKLTRRPLAAGIAGVFFTVHTVNAYTTYDLSFIPELFYSFLYILSAILFLRFLETGKRSSLAGSLLCFALSLCSKESAVTLPLTLVMLGLLYGYRLKRIASSVLPHVILLSVYLLFTLAYIGVASEALASLRHPPTQWDTGGYYFTVGPHILTNAGDALAWALNLPVGMLGQWRDSTSRRNLVLWGFAFIQVLLLAYALARGDRREVLSGFAWFWISALPAFPLMGHFLPYYMFLPIIGFSVMVGATWSRLYEDVSARSPVAAGALLGVTFTVLSLVCAKTARSEARNNFLLGASSRTAETSLRDLRSLYPAIPSSTSFFIDDDSQPDLSFHHAQGGLFKLAYGDSSLQFRYSSQKETPLGNSKLLIFRNGHLLNGQ